MVHCILILLFNYFCDRMRNLPTAPSISQIEQEGGDSGELVLIYVDPCDAVALCELFLYLAFLVLFFLVIFCLSTVSEDLFLQQPKERL